MMRFSRPEIMNAVRDLSRFMGIGANDNHMQAMHRTMQYCVGTPKRGLQLKPNGTWNNDPEFEFEITGKSDSNYATCPDTRHSVSGYSTFLNGASVTQKSAMQHTTTLSVTEAELVSGVQCAQDMLHDLHVVESVGLKVKKPMILEMDNKGAVDLANGWSIGGCTRHVEVRQNFLRELKEHGFLKVVWIASTENAVDLYTKNLPGPTFYKHAKVFVSNDKYFDSKG